MSTEKGRGRPALDDVDLSDMPGHIIQPNPEEVERRRAFASTLETPAFLERSASAGVVKVVRPRAQAAPPEPVVHRRPQSPQHTAQHTAQQAVDQLVNGPNTERERRPRADEPNLTVRLPDYVQQAVRMRAVFERTTVRLVILRALRSAGFEIDDSDMTDDRGIVAKRRTRQRTG
jgi:hypothetical protein